MSVHVHVRVFDYCMCVQGNCIRRRSGGWIVMLLMMMMIELHVHSTHYLCLLHHPHPSCFLCDLYQMPDIGCLLISTMWFASYWSLRHNFSICYLRQEVTSVVAALSWNRWSINVLNDKRKRKRKQKRGGNGPANGLLLCEERSISWFSSGCDLAVNTGTGQDEDTDKISE